MTFLSPWAPSQATTLSLEGLNLEGRAALSAFQLAPDRLHLNHGSYGAVPRVVQEQQDRIRAHVERDPTSFFGEELPAALRGMAQSVAARFGGKGDDWVFCENATAAVNGILASFPIAPGDEMVTTSHAYGAVLKAMREWAKRKGAHVTVVELPAIAESDDAIVEAIAAAFGPKSRLLVIDHITSATATVLPVKRIVERARAAGVAVLVDGAHAPGQVLLDAPSFGADWYTGNAHKWLFAPRGCGLLWTAPERQAETFPAVLSHGTDAGYRAAFDWIGTRDVSPWLCFAAGAAFHDSIPGLMDRNRLLAAEGAAILCEGLGAICAAPPQMRGAMASILLKDSPVVSTASGEFRKALARDYAIIVPVSHFADRLWLRVSAQIYNGIDDYRRCLSACLELRSGRFAQHFR
ncbi:MAG TPA: aminotransferase class V-fold PLP-dependent enzyme [Rhizomicrobium sp.]|jgi:isopenicillin-N epimerase